MNRFILPLILLLSLILPCFAFSSLASAVDPFVNCGVGRADNTDSPDICKDADSQKANDGKDNPIINIIKAAINILSYIVGIAAIIGIVVSGIRLMTAGGDSNAVASARSGLINSLIGVAIVALAQTLVIFVLDKVY